jgi:chromosome segregation ATPase
MKTINEVLSNEDLHFEHKQWHSELAFWEDELKSFKNRLSELIQRWTNKEVLAQLEHYQNEFILHEGIIDKLQETIEKHETRIAGQSKTGQESMDMVLTKKHIEFRNQMETQRQIYADLKKEFFNFLTKYM